MASKFVLRSETDVENPFMARLYGKGITSGRTVIYNTGVDGNRTAMLVLLAQGARERGDLLGCSKVHKVFYAGVEIPEFTNGLRNWRFHPGTITNPPIYLAIQSADLTANTLRIDGHGLVTGDFVAFHHRGDDAKLPTTSLGEIQYHNRYYAWVVDANNIKVLNQTTGTPNIANAFDFTVAGTNLDRVFAYKANTAYYFDPVQGRPDFFPGITITFSGLAYLEIKLPANLSNSEDEPTQLKIKMQGKQMYDIIVSGDHIAFDTATIRDDPNNALVAVDAVANDQKVALTRFGSSLVDFKIRCDGFIDWQTGSQPVAPISFPTLINASYNAATNKITKTVGTNAWDAWAVSSKFLNVDRASCETVWNGVTGAMHFNSNNTGEASLTRQGVKFENNKIWYTEGNVHTVIAPVAIGDRVRMTYEAGLFVVYKNGVAMPFVTSTQTQIYPSFYIDFVIFTASGSFEQIGVAASTLPASWAVRFFSDVNYTLGVASTTVPTISYSGNGVPPFTGVSPWGFSAIFTAKMIAPFTETFTFSSPNVDDHVEMRINGNLIFSGDYPSSPSGTMALTAGQVYDVEVKWAQSAPTITNPYFLQIKWQSASQALQLMPASVAPPRPVKRFQGGFVASTPTPASDLFEAMFALAPGTSYADIDGKIQVATIPDRTPCFRFKFDPNNPGASNVSKITIRRRNARQTPNLWRYVFRNDDDDFLAKGFTFTDRKERRALIGGKLIDFGSVISYGVLQQSQMERIGESNARLSADLDIGFQIEAFLDSLRVCKGSFVEVVDPLSGYTDSNPALCMVIDESVKIDDIETRVFEVQIITPTYYSDSDHGQVSPPINGRANNSLRPAPVALALTLTETSEPMPDGTYVSSISGEVDFTPAFDPDVPISKAQYGRIWQKILVGSAIASVTYNSGTNLFTISDPALIPVGTLPVTLASTANNYPASFGLDISYYVVNVSGSTFKLSKTISGAPEFFGSNGASLQLYPDTAWLDTGLVVTPDDLNIGTFEIIPARKSITQVKVQTFSSGGVSLDFGAAKSRTISITGNADNPSPPTGLNYTYDGVRLFWHWAFSKSPAVHKYRVTDEFNRFVSETADSSYAEVARGDRVTRRVYAVSDTGVLSASYAEVTFVRIPGLPATLWVHPVTVTINADQTVTKTGASGDLTNGSTVANKAILSDRIPAEISFALDHLMELAVGFAFLPDFNNHTAFQFGVYFDAAGLIYRVPHLSGAIDEIGGYTAGEKFILRVIPDNVVGHEATVQLLRLATNGAETLIRTMVGPVTPPLYPGLWIHDMGDTANIGLKIKGDLIPTDGLIEPAAQNLVNASYNATNGRISSTGGTGWGSSGGSFATLLQHLTDGGWMINVITAGNFAIGLSTSDVSQTADSMPINIRRDHATTQTSIYEGATLKVATTGFNVSAGDKIWIGRENGDVVIRVIQGGSGGNRVYVYSDSTFRGQDVILDLAFQHNLAASVLEIRRHFAYAKDLTPVGDTAGLSVDLQASSFVGLNSNDAIPKFNLTAPTSGQILKFNSNAELINVALPSITADPVWVAKGDLLAGTGAGAAAIRSVGSNNQVLTADSAQSTGMKWDNPLTIGRAITGGANNRVLFENGSGNLDTDATLGFNKTTGILTVGSVGYLSSPNSSSIFYGSQPSVSFSGGNNTVIGVGAGANVTSAVNNVLIGANAGGTGTMTGTGQNVYVGLNTGLNTTTGNLNTGLGSQCLTALTTGVQNIAIGYGAGNALTTGNNNVVIGALVAGALATGGNNVFIGVACGAAYTGDNNVFIGTGAGGAATGPNCVFIGNAAGQSNSGASYTTAIGGSAGQNASGGSEQVFIGAQAGVNSTATGVVCIGRLAGYQSVNPGGVYIGYQAGLNCTGSNNVFIGYFAGYNETGSNKLYIDNSSTTNPLIYGEFDNLKLYTAARDWRQRYDTSNYFKQTIDSSANVTFDLTAASGTPTFTFSKAIVARINPRVQTVSSASTVTLNMDTDDAVDVTAQAAALTINAPSGTPKNFQPFEFRFKDNGTARALTWDAIFRAVGITLPTTTVASKVLYARGKYNSNDTKYDVLAVGQE